MSAPERPPRRARGSARALHGRGSRRAHRRRGATVPRSRSRRSAGRSRARLGAALPARAGALRPAAPAPSDSIRPCLSGCRGDVDRIVEVGAGTGRLTLELLGRAREIVAIEPAAPLRELLVRRLARAEHGDRATVVAGFFDDLPLPDDWADLVVACSAFTPEAGHGGDVGPGGDGAGLPAGRLRRDRVAEQRQLARGPRLSVRQLRRRGDVRRVREPRRRGRAHRDLLSRRGRRGASRRGAGACRSRRWESIRRATSPSR